MKSGRQSAIVRRRLLNFGPGIVIALLVATFVVYQDRQSIHRARPTVRRTRIPDTENAKQGLTPELAWLLARHEQLALSAEQVKKIEALRSEWDRVTAPLRQQVDRAAEEFREWMDDAQKKGGVAINDIQQHNAEVSTLSVQLAQQRRDYWERALTLLTDEQRAQLQTERKTK